VLLATEWEPTLLGVAAIITSCGGLMTTIIASRRSGKEAKAKADEQCYERLREVRSESEQLANELHRLRMSGLPDLRPPSVRDEKPEEEEDFERWSHLP